MINPTTVFFARRMAFVVLCLSAGFIFGAVYVKPRVNAASALLAEDITIKAAEISLGSVEMKRMVDELKEAGVVSGKIAFVRQKGEVWVDARIKLRIGQIFMIGGPVFSSEDPDPQKAARIALTKFAASLKKLYGNK